MKKFNTFMACENDELALPCCVCDSAAELAEWLGCSVDWLYYCYSRSMLCCGYEIWLGVVV